MMIKNVSMLKRILYTGLLICFSVLFHSTTAIAGTATLNWNPPTTNSDGTPLTDLTGYKLYYGTSSRSYSTSINVRSSVTSTQVNNLSDGLTYYFAITAYDSSGLESDYSNEVNKTIVGTTQYTLATAKAGTGTGTITSSPAGISCGTTCTGTYGTGTMVTLTATPDASSTFSGWSGACTGTGVCAVTINAATNVTAAFNLKPTFTITPSSGTGGVISPASIVTINSGSNQTFTITPSAGYHVSSVLVDGISAGAVTTYTFSNVTTNHTISAAFAINTYTITPTAGSGGSISPASIATVNSGSNQTFTVTPTTGYHVSAVLIDGVSVGAITTYTFSNVTANHTISATFAINTYTITPTAGAGGAISPATAVSVNSGANQTLTITPSAGYSVSSVLVDGVSVGAVTTYTFSNVTANHTISATFAISTYTITPTAGAGGSISPASIATVNSGVNQTFTITSGAGYGIANVLVDGVSAGAISTYTFTNVTANHTISATFALNSYTITPSAGTGGTISPATAVSLNSGVNQTFTITPSAGYHVSAILIDGVSAGAVTTYTFSTVTANHTISATFAINTYAITPTTGTGGSISPASIATVNSGANQTFTITPASGYHVSAVLVDGASVGAITTYTFSNVTANHTISATFAINTYTITPTAGSGGSISPASIAIVNSGANQTFAITTNAGYGIANVLVDGVSVGAVSTYTFTNVAANHTISASFALNSYTIMPSAGTGGTISPATAVSVNSGANQTLTISPSAGYSVSSVLVDGVSVGAITTYTFSNVTANHTISATFAINTYTITPTAGSGGSISPVSIATVNSGANQTFTITPTSGYHVSAVLVDGVSAGAITTYTFSNVTANHTISATFAINTYTISPTAGSGGIISPASIATVNSGANPTFTITPSAGYGIANVVVDGVSAGAISTYTFTSVTANHTISASFALNSYSITPSAGSGGTISPATAISVNSGANQTFTITPGTGNSIAGVLVDGLSVGAVTTYTFSNVTANHTITASFVTNSYTITSGVSGSGGTIFPSSTLTVPAGGNGAFTISPNTGCHITDVLVDNKSIGPVTSYTFTNVTANHTIVVGFAINTYTVSASASTGGTISPSGSTSANYGGNATFSIAASAGSAISDVLVDGVSIGAVSSYTFSNIMANHTISATFGAVVANGISCPDAGIPCVERVDGQADGNNLVNNVPKVDVEFDFRSIVVDNGGKPQYVRLAMSQRSNPLPADYTMYDMNCTGDFSSGALCTYRTDLGPSAGHRFYIEAKLSNGAIVTYPQSGSIVGPQTILLNGYNLVGIPEDVRGVMLDGTTAFGTSPTYRWIAGGLSAHPGNGKYELVDTTTPPVKPGEGYFAKRSTNRTLTNMDTYTNIPDATITLALKLGWNLISDPYSGNVKLADIQVQKGTESPVSWLQAASNKWLSNAIYYFTGSDWGSTYVFRSAGGTPDAMLVPWRAYWIYVNKSDAVYSLIIHKP